MRDCETCADFRTQLRNDSKALAALAPLGALALAKEAVLAKVAGIFGGGTSTAGGGAAAGGAGAGAAGGAAGAGAAAGGVGGAIGAAGAAGGVGAGAIGAKAAGGVATAALLTAGAVEVNDYVASDTPAPKTAAATAGEPAHANAHVGNGGIKAPAAADADAKKPESIAPPAPPETEVPAETPDETVPPTDPAATGETETAEGSSEPSHGSPTVTETVSVAPAASYTWTTGTVQPAPGATTGETPPSDPPPVGDPSTPPPPPPPPSATP
jgi:hypothetical protein